MKETRAGQQPLTLEKSLARFLEMLSGKNRSSATIRAYQTDLLQFIHFLHETSVLITSPKDVTKVDVLEYFSFLARKDLTGVARARKMSALREYFRFLEGVGQIEKSPTLGVETPKRERNTRQFLRSDEYTKMLSLAGANPRDYAILQVFLQTGIHAALDDKSRWVIDGTCEREVGDFIASRADVIVWLDLPLAVKLVRLLRRSWRRVRTREVLWNGNVKTWRDVFVGPDSVVAHPLRTHFRHRRRMLARSDHAKVVRLRSTREVDAWLSAMHQQRDPSRRDPQPGTVEAG